MTEATEAFDYTAWTWEQHVAKACELAAEADRIGGGAIQSVAAQRMTDVQQIALRAEVHARLAELKKPQPVAAAAEASRPARQRADKPTGS